MILRPYQTSAIGLCREAYRGGARSVVLVAPCGAGKTAIACAVAAAHLATGAGRAVLCIVPRLELAAQMARAMRREGLRVGVLAGDAGPGEADPDAPVQVATIQTLVARELRPAASLVVLDEAHHYYGAPTWAPVVQHYRGASAILGLTATPCRSDGAALGELADAIVVAATVRELQALGHLVPARVIGPGGRRMAMAEDPVRACVEHGQGRRALVFARDMAHSRAICSGLVAAGVAASSVESDLAPAERAERLARYAAGELRVLVNCQILTEGYDDPSTEVVVLARGCSHAGTWLQIVGRAMRPSPSTGKREALVHDLCGSAWECGMPDDDRTYSLEGKAIAVSDGESLAIRQCAECGGIFRAELYVDGVCPHCGARLPARPDPRVRRERLAEIRATHTEARRAAEWQRLRAEGVKRGYKPGWAYVQFRARYGAPPR